MTDLKPGEAEVFLVQEEALALADGASESAGNLGIAIFLVSLSVLFIASLAGYITIRLEAEVWPPPGTPPLPSGLWLSTVIIILSSFTMQMAFIGARQDRQGLMRLMLAVTTLLGIAFLVCQGLNWRGLIEAQVPSTAGLFLFSFYVLTGLHALHVLGGLILLTGVTYLAFQGRYWSLHHPGVRHAAIYWHFLDVVWLVLFTVLEVV
jgi:cytochrome c oxidase subunit 3